MKKILALVMMLTGSVCAFAQSAGKEPETRYRNSITLGYNYAGGSWDAEGENLDYGMNLFSMSYYGITPGGFLFNAGVKIGNYEPDVELGDDSEVSRKFGAGIELGAGYAFINNKKAKLAVEAVYEYFFADYGFDTMEDKGGYTAYHYSYMNTKASGFGADVKGFLYFSNWFGFYSSLGFRYVTGTFERYDHLLSIDLEHEVSSMQFELNAGISFKF